MGSSWVAVGIGATIGFAVGPLLAIVFVGGFATWYLSSRFGAQLQELFIGSLQAMERHCRAFRVTERVFTNYGKVMVTRNVESAFNELERNIKSITKQSQLNAQQATNDPSGFLHKLFNVPDTREVFK